MKVFLLIGSVVLFILAALCSFFTGINVSADTITGLICAGLAAFAASFLPIP